MRNKSFMSRKVYRIINVIIGMLAAGEYSGSGAIPIAGYDNLITFIPGCGTITGINILVPAFLISLIFFIIRRNRQLLKLNRYLGSEIRERKIVEERLHAALDASGIGFWENRLDGGSGYYSEQMFRMLGYEPLPPEEAAKLFSSIMHPDDSEHVKKLIGDFTSGKRSGIYRVEFRLRNNSGYYSSILSSGKAIECDSSGAIIRMVGVHVDVTDYRMAEIALREGEKRLKMLINDLRDANERISMEAEERKASEKRFRDIADLLPQMIYESNAEGLITYTNKFGFELSGYSEEYLGKVSLRQFISPEDFNRSVEQVKRAIAGETILKNEYTFIRKDGSRVPVLIYSSPVFRDNSFAGLRGIIIDISDLKKIEEAIIAANRAKSDFLANVSHEIRTPMNAIMGLANIVLGGHLEPEQRKYVEKINSSALLLIGIINDMLDYSKIEAGKIELEEIDFRLEDVLVNLAELLSFSADEHEMELLIDMAPDLPFMIKGDPLRLGQVLINLASNAVKFGSGHDVVIRVWMEDAEAGGMVNLCFSVTDKGIGMTPEQISRLFKPFTQADSSMTRRFGGTGLGLVISKQLADLMNGTILVHSIPGEGSTFTFRAGFNVASVQDDSAGNYNFSDVRMLVVDDSDISCGIIREAIQSTGAECVSVSDPDYVLSVFKQALNDGKPFKVVITDFRMPLIDGIECIKKIREQCGYSFRSILMVSPYGRDVIAERAGETGIDMLLDRPVFARALKNTLNELLKQEPTAHIEDIQPAEGNNPKNRDMDELRKISGLKMLIVEDNRTNQLVLSAFAKKAGIESSFADNGMACVETATRKKFDIILMDIQMPVMDGYEASRELRRLGIRTPVIAVSAHALSGERENCINAGMNDYISKPVNPQELYKKILDLVRPPQSHI